MKKNLIKAFLSLWVLTLVAVSGMTLAQNPYVINIGNMDSYWVLNLGRLIMRNTGWITWIVLDWGFSSIDDYVIKIWEYAWRDDLSKLRVSNICDRKWDNCKRIADLSTWIKINGTTNGRICVKVSDQVINCDGTVVNKNETLARDSSKVVATVNGTDIKVGLPANPHKEGIITTNWALNPSIQYKEGWDVKGSVQIKWAGETRVSASNGTITVTSTDKDTKWRTVVSTQNWTTNSNTSNPYLNYVDDRNGSDAVVNGIQIHWGGYTTVESNGNVITISSTPWPGNELHYTGSLVLSNNNNPHNAATSNNNTRLYYVENEQVLNGVQIKWNNWIDVSANAGVLSIKPLLKSETKATNSSNTITNTASRQYAVVQDKDGYLSVNVPRQGTTYSANNGILLDGTTFKANLKSYTTSPNAAIDWWTNANRQYAVSLDKNGKLSVNVPRTDAGWNNIWEIGNITRNNQTLSNAIRPASTYISKDLYLPERDIYHDGNVLIKTLWSNATYRTNDIRITDYGVSIGEMANRTAWLWVHWPITVGKYSQDPWRPWYCPQATQRNTISIYASWAAGSDNFEIIWNPRVLIWAKDAWYIYFTAGWDAYKGNIWVNTTNPHAKLDIKGSIRVGYCSQDKYCDADSAWEIKYYEKNNVWYFVWCRKTSSSSWERVVLSDWTQTKTDNDVSYNCSTSPSVPYNTSVYSTQLAQPGPDCQ